MALSGMVRRRGRRSVQVAPSSVDSRSHAARPARRPGRAVLLPVLERLGERRRRRAAGRGRSTMPPGAATGRSAGVRATLRPPSVETELVDAHPEQALGDRMDPRVGSGRTGRSTARRRSARRAQLGDVPAARLARPAVPVPFGQAQVAKLPRLAADRSRRRPRRARRALHGRCRAGRSPGRSRR